MVLLNFQPMKKITLIFCLFSLVIFSGKAQESEDKEKVSLMDRLYFGGNLGFQFGNITFIDASPLVGYKITPKLSGGVGGTYRYTKDKRYVPAYEYDITGWRVFARYNVTPILFPYAEYESLSLKIRDSSGLESDRQWSDAIFVGAGLMQPIGRRGGISLLLLYNLNYVSANAFYGQPYVFRVGFIF